jgi:hypothetical protein
MIHRLDIGLGLGICDGILEFFGLSDQWLDNGAEDESED